MLKKNLTYDATQDLVEVFTENGAEHTSTIVDQAMVVLLSGIHKRWVQPVPYTIGHASTPLSELCYLIMCLIKQLKEIAGSLQSELSQTAGPVAHPGPLPGGG